MMHRTMYECTLLACEPGHRLTKRYASPEADPEPYDAGVLFSAEPIRGDWFDFIEFLGALPPEYCLIRGGIRAEATETCAAGTYVRRLAYDREGCDAAFEARSRNWIVLDADETDAPFDLDNPDASIRAWRASLPDGLASCRAAFFPSASAHRSPTVRGKLLVALDEPIDNATAAAWAKAHGFDGSVCGAVQPNYFAAPIFASGGDPLGECRSPTMFDGEPLRIVGETSPKSAELGDRAPNETPEADYSDRVIELAATIYDRWLDGGRVETHAWLHLCGWLLGLGWSRGELVGMLDLLDRDEPSAAKRAEHVHILSNARATSGPGGARAWLGAQFGAIDALANYDPVVAGMIERREERAALAISPADPDALAFAPALPGLVLATDKQGRPLPTVSNVMRFLEHAAGDHIRYEEFSGKIMCAGLPADWHMPDGVWTDNHTTHLVRVLNDIRMQIGKDVVRDSVGAHAKKHAHNVLTEWLWQCAEAWDGVRRVDGAMARYWGAVDDAATRAVSRVFFLSLAARGLTPGCKVDTALLLIGAQGLRKSTSLLALVGASAFSDSPLPIGDKDALQNIRGKWLWEIAENASASRKDRDTVKAFLSASSDTYRASYGRDAETIPRQTCFAVSSNDAEPLNDPTGARRYLPLVLGARIDIEGIERDRIQLLGEAACRVLCDEQHWATAEEDAALAPSRHATTELCVREDPWEDAIATWIEARRPVVPCAMVDTLAEAEAWDGRGEVTPFLLTDLTDSINGAIPMPVDRLDKRTQMRIAAVLRRMGLARRQNWRGKWVWAPAH